MSQKLLFIFNPHSGKGQIKNNLVEIIDTMVKADFEVTAYTTQAQGMPYKKWLQKLQIMTALYAAEEMEPSMR